jgi:hypothetical protein
MLDDDQLASLLARAGDAFEVPATGADDILARAAGAPAAGVEHATGAPGAPAAPGDEAELNAEAGDRTAPRGEGRVRRLAAVAGRHRVLSAAACLVVALLVAGAVAAVVRSPSSPTATSGLPPIARSPLHSVASTTVPPGPGAPGSTQFNANAPAPSSGVAVPGGASTPAVTTPTAPALPSGAVGQPAKIEQTGTLGLTVGRGDLGRTMTSLTSLAGAYGGFVASSQTQSGPGSGGAPYGSVTLQVPVDSFSAVLKQAQSLGKTASLTTRATDVTGQYVDLQARIAALEDSRQQYLTILAKATTIGDILSVQEQLDTIQSEIEQLQGQLQLLSSETSYSTLTVTVSEGTAPPRPGPLPESGLVQAWHDSIGGFVAGVEGLVRIAGPVLFALLCLSVALLGGRALWRRYQRHNL